MNISRVTEGVEAQLTASSHCVKSWKSVENSGIELAHGVKQAFLFKIMAKLGCPTKCFRIIKKLYSGVHARLYFDGDLSKPFEYNSGVKQCYKRSPTLFGMYSRL